MTDVLSFVTLPSSAERTLHSDEEIRMAKIRLLQKALAIEEQKAIRTLSERSVKEIEETIQAVDVGSFVEQEHEVPEFLTVRDVSKLTGLAPQVVRRHCVAGKYEAHQVAGENSTWRIDPKQFTSFPNWSKFLVEREQELERSKAVADLALKLWEGKGPVDTVEE